MATKATLNINPARAKNTSRWGPCSADTRNGACPNNTVGHHTIGTGDEQLYVNLCRRHDRMYDAEDMRLRDVLGYEHESGLHGEGDDRKAFAEPHVRGEYWDVRCRKCSDEIASEGLGVSADQVQEAMVIKHRKDQHDAAMLRFTERFTEMVESRGPIAAVSYFGDAAAKLAAVDDLWKQVQAYQEGAFSWGETKTMNLVEAYNMVVNEQKEQLISDSINRQRSTISHWVRG